MVQKLPILKLVLFCLQISGLHPEKQTILSHILKFTVIATFIALFLTNFLELFLNWKGVQTVANVPMFPSLLMFLVKLLCLIIKNRELGLILRKLDLFWAMDKFGLAIKKRLLVPHARAGFLLKYYCFTCNVVLLLYSTIPFVSTSKLLLFPGYKFCDFNVPPCFEYHFGLQIAITIVHIIPVVIGFDALFILLVTYGYSALELVKYSFREVSRLNDSVENQELVDELIRDIINQHNIILEFIKMLNHFYKEMLLVQCWSSLGSLIFCLYMITYDGIPPSITALGQHGTMYSTISVQLLMYCLGGAFLMDQTTTVADEAFAVNWWLRTQPKLRKQLALIIQRSHKAEKLSVGNMTVLNLVTFVSILKNSLSIYTLLLNLESSTEI